MMNRIVLMSTIASLTLLLGGCFDDDDKKTSSSGTPTTPPSTDPGSSGEPPTTQNPLQQISALSADAEPIALTDIGALQAAITASFGGADDEPKPLNGSASVADFISQ
ncbi:MAG: hypothetical protein ACWA44_10315 [Thiotrichales bacterium]